MPWTASWRPQMRLDISGRKSSPVIHDTFHDHLVGPEAALPQQRVDVIVPVYRNFEATRRCLRAVLAAPVSTPFELVVVDDAAPEEALAEWLSDEARAGQFTLLRNATNLGFVASVNRGMALHPDRDVVLLNSDTEVANDWLDRIVRCAGAEPRIATVTPFSNNATICSYPFDGWQGQLPGGLGLAALDALFARTLAGEVVDLPTAVGFCMFIRRACLDAVGVFDERTFGRGYGEENDFSLRAAKAGWRNVLCADTFVFHQGGVSFGGERTELMRNAARALLNLHPDYDCRVAAFLAADPVRGLRDVLDLARVHIGGDEAAAVFAERRLQHDMLNPVPSVPSPDGLEARPVILHVCHNWGGGTLRWIEDFAKAKADCRHLLIRMGQRRDALGDRLELVDVGGGGSLMSWSLAQPIVTTATTHAEYARLLKAIVEAFGVGQVIVSSLIGHSLDVFDTGLPTLVVLHDFHPFCPAMFAWFDGPCTSCGEAELRACLAGNPYNVLWGLCDPVHRLELRAAYGRCFAREQVDIVAPSRSLHARYAQLFPVLRGIPWHFIPHGIDSGLARPLSRRRALPGQDRASRRLRLVLPGRLSPHKGLELLHAMVDELAGFADLLLLGAGEFGKAFAYLPNVQVVDDYAKEELAGHVEAFGADCALLLSVVPESFSYTLSELWALGLPVVATRRGALAERVRDGETGFLVESEAGAIVSCLRRLADDRSVLEKVADNVRNQPVRSVEAMVRDYEVVLLRHRSGTGPGGVVLGLWEALRHRDAWQWRDASIDALTRQLAEQRAIVDAMHASTSWRITRALRGLKGLLNMASGRRPDTFPAGEDVDSAPPIRSDVPAPEGRRAGDWARLLPHRADFRIEKRAALFVPDCARLVVGRGRMDSESGLIEFAQVAMETGRRHNGYVFVWLGRRDEAWYREHGREVALPVACGRLLFVDEVEFESWFLASDVYLGCRPEGVHDADAHEARLAGLPVVLAHENAQPRSGLMADVVAPAIRNDHDEPLWKRVVKATEL